MKPHPVFYNCDNCPSYCCSYTEIEVTFEDIERLALHLDADIDVVSRRFTMESKDPYTRVMRHFRDPVFGTACRLLDLETRRCKAYEARPTACRVYPGTSTCHYYQFLMAERRLQGKPKVAVRAYNLVQDSEMGRHPIERRDTAENSGA